MATKVVITFFGYRVGYGVRYGARYGARYGGVHFWFAWM